MGNCGFVFCLQFIFTTNRELQSIVAYVFFKDSVRKKICINLLAVIDPSNASLISKTIAASSGV